MINLIKYFISLSVLIVGIILLNVLSEPSLLDIIIIKSATGKEFTDLDIENIKEGKILCEFLQFEFIKGIFKKNSWAFKKKKEN